MKNMILDKCSECGKPLFEPDLIFNYSKCPVCGHEEFKFVSISGSVFICKCRQCEANISLNYVIVGIPEEIEDS